MQVTFRPIDTAFPFSIDPVSGEIKVSYDDGQQDMDFETTTKYSIQVTATDNESKNHQRSAKNENKSWL